MGKAGRKNKLLVIIILVLAIYLILIKPEILSNFSDGIAAFSRSWEKIPIFGIFSFRELLIGTLLIMIVYNLVYPEKRFLT